MNKFPQYAENVIKLTALHTVCIGKKPDGDAWVVHEGQNAYFFKGEFPDGLVAEGSFKIADEHQQTQFRNGSKNKVK